MYDIKRSGKSHFAVYDPRMRERIMERVQLRQDLIRATDDDQFHLHYQPLFALQTGDITGTEALIRWTHPTRGPVRPDDFLAVAEETGLILPIGERVLVDACRQTAEWSRTLQHPLSINVNLSPRQLLHAGLPRLVERAVAQSGFYPWQLVLEITEHEMLESCGSSVATLATLKEIGVRIAIDDFGTGYSALAYLRTLPLDILKIPKPFVDDIETDDGGLLAHAIIEMSHALGLQTVAEGIETPLQFSRLKEWGCDIGQGFMVSPPDSAPMIQRFLAAEITRMRRAAAPAGPSSDASPRPRVSSVTSV
jgi:EAL domain-containing protein (putative c-di-GMP-specific phosphodiesterase class I)